MEQHEPVHFSLPQKSIISAWELRAGNLAQWFRLPRMRKDQSSTPGTKKKGTKFCNF